MENRIENVIVDNGILEHKVQWIHSPSEIKNVVARALAFVSDDIKKEINSKNLTVFIKTKVDYSLHIHKTIINADRELLLRFNGTI